MPSRPGSLSRNNRRTCLRGGGRDGEARRWSSTSHLSPTSSFFFAPLYTASTPLLGQRPVPRKVHGAFPQLFLILRRRSALPLVSRLSSSSLSLSSPPSPAFPFSHLAMPPDPRDHHRRRRSSTHSRPPSIPSQDVPRQSIEDAYEPERHGDSGDESDGTQATEIDNRPVHERLGHHSDRARELAEWQHAHRNSISRNERGVTVPPHLRGESEEQQRRSESRLGTPYHLFNREETVDGPEPAGNSAFHAASRQYVNSRTVSSFFFFLPFISYFVLTASRRMLLV